MRRSAGFTLIELMIAVVVVAILAAIAYPSYDSYMKRARRSDAQQLIQKIATRESQYLLDARSYLATIGGANSLNITSDGWTCAATCTNGHYTVSVAVDNTATPPTYTITGAPSSTSQASDGNLTLDSTGAKTRAGNPGW